MQKLGALKPRLSQDLEKKIEAMRALQDPVTPRCNMCGEAVVVPKQYLKDMGVPNPDYWVSPNGIPLSSIRSDLDFGHIEDLRAEGLPCDLRTPPDTACINYVRCNLPETLDLSYTPPSHLPKGKEVGDLAELYLTYFNYDPEDVITDVETGQKMIHVVRAKPETNVLLMTDESGSYKVKYAYEQSMPECEWLIREVYHTEHRRL